MERTVIRQPCQVVEIGGLDDQRIAFPAAGGVAQVALAVIGANIIVVVKKLNKPVKE